MRFAVLGLFLAGVLTVSGCSGPSAPQGSAAAPKTDAPVSSNDDLKKMLEQIATTGEAGSAAAGLAPSIEKIKKDDPAKGAVLEKELAQLQGTSDPAKIKEIAKKMADSL